MRSLIVCVLAALVLAGCTSRVGGTAEDSPSTAAGPVDLAVPIELRPVLETTSADPTATVLPGPDDEQLTLVSPILTIHRLDSAEVTFEETGSAWVLSIDLIDTDAVVFGDWTTEHMGERLAMVADDEVLMAPQIQGAITGGKVQITANYTQTEARALLDKITGR